MLTCHACMKRCLQNIIGDSALVSSSRPNPFSTIHRRQNYRRSHSPVRRVHTSPARDLAKPAVGRAKDASNINFKVEKGTVSTSYNRQKWLESRGVTPLHKRKERETDGPLIKKQLKHLKDPLKLAEHVRATLREDDFETALAVVRAASKDTQCIVSWNHLIDWQLSRGKMNGAIKTYNEMKKRAQIPDAYTYTIIFRGCAEHPLPDQALAKVITIYNAMLTDKSPIKPNTIHMNAVLKMCAKANNMDALFSIAAHLPAKGLRAPNNLTYTIIFNAIRMHTLISLRGNLTPVQLRKIRQKANLDARLIWEDITKRWREGDVMIDEDLVCTMGRVLLLGNASDIDDVMSLIEQTMNIPRQVPRLGTPERHIRDSRQAKNITSQDQGAEGLSSVPDLVNSNQKLSEAATNTLGQSSEELPSENGAMIASLEHREDRSASNTEGEPENVEDDLRVAIADPFKSPALTKIGTGFYVKPGQNTLSLLMAALLDLRLKEPATKYWNILTNEHAVEPDADNYHSYFRVLRFARASTETVQLLLKMPKTSMQVKTFRITMATCLRDKNNQWAFSNAGKVLDLMQTVLQVPDIEVLYNYLDVAFSCQAYSHKEHSNGKYTASKYEQGKRIKRALERINSSYVNLRSLMAYGDPTKPAATDAEKALLTEAVLRLTQKMVSAHDILMDKGMVERTMYTELAKQRAKLAAFITRYKDHKLSFPRSSLPAAMGNDINRYKKHLSRITNPELQRRISVAKKGGPEAYTALMEEFATGVNDDAERDEKVLREPREENVKGRFTETSSHRQRVGAEAAWPHPVDRTAESRQTL